MGRVETFLRWLVVASLGAGCVAEPTPDFQRTVAARGTHSGNLASPLDLRVTPVQDRDPVTRRLVSESR